MSEEIGSIVKAAVIASKLFRRLGGKKLYSRLRSRGFLSIAQRLHIGVIHDMRKFSIYMEDWSPQTCDHAHDLAVQVVTSCRDVMSDLLELDDSSLHCCLKVHVPGDGDSGQIVTWARSEPQDYHHDDNILDGGHLVTNNSTWASLMGKSDGKTKWEKPYSCFCCNDLNRQGDKFICSREKWREHYNSTMVFPLRYVENVQQRRFSSIGFLAFYSKKSNIFIDCPNIFDHLDDLEVYETKLANSTPFQVGAMMADILSTFARQKLESNHTYKAAMNTLEGAEQ